MSARPSTTKTETAIPADAYRAFADWLSDGNTGSFDAWYASDNGKAAIVAFETKTANAAKAARMAQAKAVWRDFKVNGSVHTEKGKQAAAALLDYLKNADLTVTGDEPAATEGPDSVTE